MPRTIESIVNCHKAASELRSQNKPIWKRTVPLKDLLSSDPSTTDDIVKKAHEIARRLDSFLPKTLTDPDSEQADHDIIDIIESFKSMTAGEFDGEADDAAQDDLNGLLDQTYDWADLNRVWIK